MSQIYLKYGAIVSSLGVGKEEHVDAFITNRSGIHKYAHSGFNGEDWFLGKIKTLINNRYNHLLTIACNELLNNTKRELLHSERTLLIVSSTKGNINDLPNDPFDSTREILLSYLGIVHRPVILSNACVSGVMAINLAADYIQSGHYDHVIVLGIDCISDFVVFGFQSLYALSNTPCLPFDAERNGISIGEACGIVILSNQQGDGFSVQYCGGASSNDANHISGPSRTGEGLVRAVSKAMKRTGIAAGEIEFISAHGTGTSYNDEMESIAFDRLGLHKIPLNSLKAYVGHTLGAAGVIEVIISLFSMEKNILFKSIGFSNNGTSKKINVIRENENKNINIVLKTASGFGGTNAALLLKKIA